MKEVRMMTMTLKRKFGEMFSIKSAYPRSRFRQVRRRKS
jgi:hypothetical protein